MSRATPSSATNRTMNNLPYTGDLPWAGTRTRQFLAGDPLPRGLAGHPQRGADPRPGDAARPRFGDPERELPLHLAAGGRDLGQGGEQHVIGLLPLPAHLGW